MTTVAVSSAPASAAQTRHARTKILRKAVQATSRKDDLVPPLPKEGQTAIDRLLVAEFSASSKDKELLKLWDAHKMAIQKGLVQSLNEESHLSAEPLSEPSSLLRQRAPPLTSRRTEGADGIIVGEFSGKTIEMSLLSSATGQSLASWSLPIVFGTAQRDHELVLMTARSVVTGFPYRGFIMGPEGHDYVLNISHTTGIKPGMELDVFEFEGDKQNFKSSQKSLGKILITQVNSSKVTGRPTKDGVTFPRFAKVSFATTAPDLEDTLRTRVHRRFWVAVGPEFFFLDTQVSDVGNQTLAERVYQVPLSPFLSGELGYSKFQVSGVTGSASNASNKVRFLQVTGSFEFLSFRRERWGYITALGGYYSNYNATVLQGATLPLTSLTRLAPMLEQRLQTALGSQTLFWVTGQLFFPLFSNDPDNGASQPVTSGGLGLASGIRIDLSKAISLDSGIRGRILREQLQNGGDLEFQYGFFLKLLGRF